MIRSNLAFGIKHTFYGNDQAATDAKGKQTANTHSLKKKRERERNRKKKRIQDLGLE